MIAQQVVVESDYFTDDMVGDLPAVGASRIGQEDGLAGIEGGIDILTYPRGWGLQPMQVGGMFQVFRNAIR